MLSEDFIFIAVVMLLFGTSSNQYYGVHAKAPACQKAQQSCQTSPTCGLQLHNAMIKCGNMYADNSDGSSNDASSDNAAVCSDECRISLLELERGTREGRDYARCSCNITDSQDGCYSQKAIFQCRREPTVGSGMISDTPAEFRAVSGPNTCNAARRLCADNTVCRDALHYYEMVCEKSQAEAPDRYCPSLQCLESFEILMRQEDAQFLIDCHCTTITPDPNVIYCFKQDFFKRCSVADITELEGHIVNAAATKVFCKFPWLVYVALIILFFSGR